MYVVSREDTASPCMAVADRNMTVSSAPSLRLYIQMLSPPSNQPTCRAVLFCGALPRVKRRLPFTLAFGAVSVLPRLSPRPFSVDGAAAAAAVTARFYEEKTPLAAAAAAAAAWSDGKEIPILLL